MRLKKSDDSTYLPPENESDEEQPLDTESRRPGALQAASSELGDEEIN